MPPSLTRGVRRHRLDNGLTVLIRPVHAAPVIALNTWVKAGYFHEPDEKAGMAHLFEHMFFKGSERFPGAERIGEEVSRLGGVLNAGTIYDSTNYYFVLPAEAFERGVAIQADAVIHPLFDPGELRKEAEVVIEESNRKYDNPPAYATERMFALAFREHRMHRWRIGDNEVLRNINRDDLLAFFEDLYRPENIIVTIVGDVDPERALEIVAREYAPLPRGTVGMERGPAEPAQEGFRFLEETGSITQSRLVCGWHTRGYGHEDNEALEILSVILGAGKTSRLYRHAVGPDAAAGASAYNYPVDDIGVFVVSAHFQRERLDGAQTAVFQEIERMRREPPSGFEVETARAQILSGFLLSQEEVLGQSSVLASREARGDYREIDRYLERLAAVTPGDVMRVAEAYLSLDRASLFRYLERPTEGTAAEAAGPGTVRDGLQTVMTAAPAPRDPDPPVAGLLEADLSAPESDAPAATHEEVLSNGVRLLVQESHHLPTAWVGAYFEGGRSEEAPATAGITRLTLSGALRGTRRRSAEEIDRAIESLGSGFAADFHEDSFGLTASVAVEHLAPVVGLLREVVTEATFPEAGVEKGREIVLAGIRAARDSSIAHPLDLFSRAFYGADHPFGLPQRGSLDAVASMTPADLAAWYRRTYDPSRLTLVFVGNVDPVRVRAFAEEQFGGLPADGEAPPPLPAFTPPRGMLEAVEQRPRRQSAFVMGFPSAALGSRDYFALEVLQGILSGMAGRFFAELRGRRSLAYSVMAGDVARPEAGFFFGYLAGEHPKEEEARRVMLAEFERLRDEPVSDEELERAKGYLAGVTKIRLQTNAQRGTDLIRNRMLGLELDFTRRYLEAVATITAEDIRRAAAATFHREHCAVGILRGGEA
jgi:zinc protease